MGYYGFHSTKNGLLLSDVVLKHHYLHDFLVLTENYFPVLPGSMVTRHINYTRSSDNKRVTFEGFQQNVLTQINGIATNKFIDRSNNPSTPGICFLPSMINFYNGQLPSGYPPVTTIPESQFYSTLSSYLQLYGSSSDLVCRNQTNNELTDCLYADGVTLTLEATQTSTYYSNISTDNDYVDAIKSIRRQSDNLAGNQDNCCHNATIGNGTRLEPPPIFFSGYLFKYWQQYVDIRSTAAKTVGFSLVGVFGVTLIFQANPITSLLVGVMLLSTVLQLYGFMAALDIKLNGWSVTNLAIAVGISVEFSAYVSYAFLRAHADHEKPNDRMRQALIEMFPPMLNGAIATEISVVVLAFARFPFFRLYYFVMISMTILLAFFNGMVFLPIILSIIAPKGFDRVHRAQSLTSGGLHDKGVDLVDSKADLGL
jgi:hypothetical protein